MRTRKINLEVLAVGFGVIGFSHGYGPGPSDEGAIELTRKAHELGCTFDDTAEGYGTGENERSVGRALAPIRDDIVKTSDDMTHEESSHLRAARHADTRAACLLDNPSTDMQITRNTLDANAGVADWFTDSVFIDTVTTPTPPSRLGAALVHFTPGARMAWHTHFFCQTIFVTEGMGLCQREGWADRAHQARREPLARAAPIPFMTHLAMQEADDSGSPVTRGEHVSDEQYSAARAS